MEIVYFNSNAMSRGGVWFELLLDLLVHHFSNNLVGSSGIIVVKYSRELAELPRLEKFPNHNNSSALASDFILFAFHKQMRTFPLI